MGYKFQRISHLYRLYSSIHQEQHNKKLNLLFYLPQRKHKAVLNMRFTQIVAAALCLGATEAAVAPIDRARQVLGNQHAFDKRDATGDTAKAPKHLNSKNKSKIFPFCIHLFQLV